MNGIIEWYSAFSSTEQVFWACAIIGSVIFLIQLVFTLIGMDASDVEVDFDGANTLDMGGWHVVVLRKGACQLPRRFRMGRSEPSFGNIQ